ncbi:MAG: hypothetical protein KBC95_05270, partial [Candidatus Peribacteraceae bacterium]|nr:hypothetical protein [Candidatus Peribacteraceae bacterium]
MFFEVSANVLVSTFFGAKKVEKETGRCRGVAYAEWLGPRAAQTRPALFCGSAGLKRCAATIRGRIANRVTAPPLGGQG